MKIKRISIYGEFQCTGADCPASCCKGWRIPLDDKIYQKYLLEKGVLGYRLRSAIRKEEDVTAFRSVFGKCPFWGRDRLCSIQKKHGTEYMPWICMQFPRRLYHLGFFCEEALYLSCPEAAGLFLAQAQQGGHFPFEEIEGEVSYEVNTTNDDKDFLEYLLSAREQLIQMLEKGCRFDSKSILDYGRDAQNACLAGKALPFPLAFGNRQERLVMDVAALNKLFFNGFYHPRLKTQSPFLYQLCQKYRREFEILSVIREDAANRKLDSLRENLYQKVPKLDVILDRYYEYYLQTDFLNIYEDYSFSKNLLFGMVKAHMLWVLIALFAKNRKTVSNAQVAKIIAVFERRAPRIGESHLLFEGFDVKLWEKRKGMGE